MNPNSRWIIPILSCLSLSNCMSGPNVSPERYARVLEPPAQYQRPYLGHLIIRWRSPEVVAYACPHGIACAFPLGPNQCVIVLNREYRAHAAALLRHEQAHCLGWPGSHPRS